MPPFPSTHVRVDLQQTHVLGELIFTLIELVIRELHALHVEVQLLSGQQSFFPGEIAEFMAKID